MDARTFVVAAACIALGQTGCWMGRGQKPAPAEETGDSDAPADTAAPLDTGEDADTGEAEDTDTLTAADCNGATWPGDFTVGETGPLTVLLGYVAVEGDLTVSQTDLHDLDGLHCLESIGGRITICENESLRSISGLVNVDGAVGLLVRENPALEAIDGLYGITALPAGAVIRANPSLASLEGLASLEWGGKWFNINDNASLASLEDLAALQAAGSVSFTIAHCDGLADLSGLESLKAVGSAVIDGNGALETLAGLEGLEQARGLRIADNGQLEDITALSAFERVGRLAIVDNDALETLAGLDSLAAVEQGIEILENGALADLAGFAPDCSLGEQHVLVSVKDNPLLSTCGVVDLVAAYGAPCAGIDIDAEVCGNLPDGCGYEDCAD